MMELEARALLEWCATRPLPRDVPPSASNLCVFQIREAIAAGVPIPYAVWAGLGPGSQAYHVWASRKTVAEILLGSRDATLPVSAG